MSYMICAERYRFLYHKVEKNDISRADRRVKYHFLRPYGIKNDISLHKSCNDFIHTSGSEK